MCTTDIVQQCFPDIHTFCHKRITAIICLPLNLRSLLFPSAFRFRPIDFIVIVFSRLARRTEQHTLHDTVFYRTQHNAHRYSCTQFWKSRASVIHNDVVDGAVVHQQNHLVTNRRYLITTIPVNTVADDGQRDL